MKKKTGKTPTGSNVNKFDPVGVFTAHSSTPDLIRGYSYLTTSWAEDVGKLHLPIGREAASEKGQFFDGSQDPNTVLDVR